MHQQIGSVTNCFERFCRSKFQPLLPDLKRRINRIIIARACLRVNGVDCGYTFVGRHCAKVKPPVIDRGLNVSGSWLSE
jgi:hypothetical protein